MNKFFMGGNLTIVIVQLLLLAGVKLEFKPETLLITLIAVILSVFND